MNLPHYERPSHMRIIIKYLSVPALGFSCIESDLKVIVPRSIMQPSGHQACALPRNGSACHSIFIKMLQRVWD
jgi:hypothetical protein